MHPARIIPFSELRDRLIDHVVQGNIREVMDDDLLTLYCYTEKCTYDKKWDSITLLARGLILDKINSEVIATPFPKFFNIGENQDCSLPAQPFTTYEKLDGSLIIVFYHNGKWKTATKGSFRSDQAKWAREWLLGKEQWLVPGNTYLFEAIYTQNRIVVHYDYEGLVLLGGYRSDGCEFSEDTMFFLSQGLGCRAAETYQYKSVLDLLTVAKTLPATAEGFIIKFDSGLRLKVKGDEYCRIHRLVSRLTPLAMWEAMLAGDDLDEIRKQLPEEFWIDFDNIISILSRRVNALVEKIYLVARTLADLTDKEVGLKLDTFPEEVRSFLFPYRKNKGDLLHGRARQKLFMAIRPHGNILEGYMPSSVVNSIMEEGS